MTKRRKCIALAVYGILMLWLLFAQRLAIKNEVGIQLQPFHTLSKFLWVLRNSANTMLRLQAWANLVGNVVMFVPLGFLFPWIWETWRVFWRHTLLMAAMILAVEATQVMTGLGYCDVDDLILNLPGTGLGFLLWKWIHKTRWA